MPAEDNQRAEARKRARVLAATLYPVEGASTRLRVWQYIGVLARHGVDVDLRPFLTAALFAQVYDRRRWFSTIVRLAVAMLRRATNLLLLFRTDVLFVQRESALIGPPSFEWLACRLFKRPLILDLDDANYIEQPSPVYGRLAMLLKWRGKTAKLIDLASLVICGNETIAAYVRERGRRAIVQPTIVDTATYVPRDPAHQNDVPVIGWVGSRTTYPYFETLIPVLERLAAEHRFRVRVVGSSRESITIRSVDVEVLPWSRSREVEDFNTLDIGVYPLPSDDWAEGKSGLKAIEYLSTGVPYVASPVGIVAELGEAGKTHLFASKADEWYDALALLLRDASARRAMSLAARAYAVAHFSVEAVGGEIAGAIRSLAEGARGSLPS